MHLETGWKIPCHSCFDSLVLVELVMERSFKQLAQSLGQNSALRLWLSVLIRLPLSYIIVEKGGIVPI